MVPGAADSNSLLPSPSPTRWGRQRIFMNIWVKRFVISDPKCPDSCTRIRCIIPVGIVDLDLRAAPEPRVLSIDRLRWHGFGARRSRLLGGGLRRRRLHLRGRDLL